MREKLSVQDVDLLIHERLSRLESQGMAYTRTEIGARVEYVVFERGAEIGRIGVYPDYKLGTEIPYTSWTATALKRAVEQAIRDQTEVGSVPGHVRFAEIMTLIRDDLAFWREQRKKIAATWPEARQDIKRIWVDASEVADNTTDMLLSLLQDTSLSYEEIADAVSLSPDTVARRGRELARRSVVPRRRAGRKPKK